jgi:hypothetical protein
VTRGTLVVAALTIGVGCSRAATREQMEDRYRDELVGRGLDAAVAQCVVDGFFAELSDDEAKAFHARDELTPDEARRFAELGQACGGGG